MMADDSIPSGPARVVGTAVVVVEEDDGDEVVVVLTVLVEVVVVADTGVLISTAAMQPAANGAHRSRARGVLVVLSTLCLRHSWLVWLPSRRAYFHLFVATIAREELSASSMPLRGEGPRRRVHLGPDARQRRYG
jgi:hypothetical protein